MTVANSVIKDNASNTVANPARTRSLPLSNSISPQADIVKRKKKESDQIPLSIQTEKIQRHKKSAEKSGNSPKSYAIDGVIRKIAKQRIR